MFEVNITQKEQESIDVIKNMIDKYDGYQVVLNTSMGKDSKLTEYLLKKVTDNYRKFFNNTTLDCADVYKEAKSSGAEIVTPKDKDGKNLGFYKLVQSWGIPTRFSRWCCRIFKEEGTYQYLNGQKNVLFVMGMRNEESNTRANYNFEYKNPNWQEDSWVGCLPIRKWSELELWLYTIHNNIPINAKYRKGYTRVGCNVACPYYTKSTWILDKYWYPKYYDRWHKIIEKDFIDNEKWTRMNCTLAEYHMNYNGGVLREQPTDEVIKEFQQHKNIDDTNIVEKYFNKKCENCGKSVVKQNEVAMNLKIFGRDTKKFYCKKCLMKKLNWNKEDWDKQVEKFQQEGCVLF